MEHATMGTRNYRGNRMKKLLAVLLIVPTLCFAWEPTKPIEAIIAWGPGSVNELLFRALSKKVEENTNAKFIVINRGGAGGVIGTEELSKKPADGYSVTMVSIPGLAAMDRVSVPGPSRTYTTDSFDYPFFAASMPFAIVGGASEVLDNPKLFARAIQTRQISIAATGGARLAYEAMADKLTIQEDNAHVVRIDHQSPVAALSDVAGGSVRFAVVPVLIANSFYKDKRVKIVALTGNRKLPQLPEVGLLSEAIPGFNVSGTWGLILPKGAPKEVLDWYHTEFTKAMNSPEVRTLYENNLLLEVSELNTQAAYTAYVKQREVTWKPLVDKVLQKMDK